MQVDGLGLLECEIVEIDADSGVVFGRSPDPALVTGVDGLIRRTLSSPSVSTNHVAVWHDGDRVLVRDLASRNGTWLRVPPDTDAVLPRGTNVHLRLGWQARDNSSVS
ncbi:MAG TPA: FHA domain-containing protein, partial [Kofleriaceae bacterium]|nr:FHA domain-containing protein [Kofleriaceae bacterium]